MLPQIRTLMRFNSETNTISLDNNIADKIIRVINVSLEKRRTKNRALTNTSINEMILWRLLIKGNHPKPSIPRRWQNKAENLIGNSVRLKFGKRNNIPNRAKSLEWIKCYSSSSPTSILKTPKILSNAPAKRSAVEEDLKSHSKAEKRLHFWSNQQPYFFKCFSKIQPTIVKLTGRYFAALDLSQIFLNTGTRDGTFQQPEKHDSFKHILNISANMYESSGSRFFRTTTGIYSRQGAFKESRSVIAFLTIF